MLVTIHQPDFLPWLGFFDRWKRSDLFIILDDVQFIRRGWHHRDKIMTPDGVKWLTVPVKKKGRYSQKINEVEIDYSTPWQKNHLNLLRSAYAKVPNFDKIYNELSDIFSTGYQKLAELNTALLRHCSELLSIDTPVIFSSSIDIIDSGTERLVKLVQSVGGDGYLSGVGAKDYIDEDLFNKNNINLFWQNFNHPVYPQLNGNFNSMLSVIDYMMMVHSPYSLFK